MQVVFQDPYNALSPRMTIEQIVGEGLALHHPELDAGARRDAIVAMLGDTSREHRTYFVSHPSSTDQRTLWRALGTTLDRGVFVVPVPKPLLYGLMKLGVSKQLDEKQYKQIIAPGFVCSSSALSRDTGWKPQFDLSSSLAKAAAGFRRAQWL
jgi:microcin C transport system ATP-binding protein